MATQKEKEELMEILKFTPCTYKIQIWGYGGEVVLGEIERKQFDYFRDNRLNVSDYAYDWDYFRTFDYADTSQRSLPAERSGNAKLQNATMIIEYDPDILTDPPP